MTKSLALGIRRWSAFNAVGAAGIGVQIGVLSLLTRGLHLHYLAATALAVEAAVLHNFAWHQVWTWSDRPAGSRRTTLTRLGRFHALNGVISLAGNLALMAVLTGVLHIAPVTASLVAITVCSLINFAASETHVFRSAGLPAATVLLLIGAPSSAAAGPGAPTAAAWRAYEAAIDARYLASGPGDRVFFVHDRNRQPPGWRGDVQRGEIRMMSIDTPSVIDGRIHHWAGAVFVPGVTLDGVLRQLKQNAGRESEAYDDVVASRLVSQAGDRLHVFMKLRRSSLITVMYNTEHDVEYRRLSALRAVGRSVATRIAELADAGTPGEREKAADEERGFLWRLNAYWRYEQVDGGVLIECESVSLSRPVPALLGPLVNPMVSRIARESLEHTLRSVRTVLAANPGHEFRRSGVVRSMRDVS